MSEWIALEGYGVYVWPSYAAMAAILIGLAAGMLWRNAKVRAELAELEARVAAAKAGRR